MAAVSTGARERTAGKAGVPLRLHCPTNPAARIQEPLHSLEAGKRTEVSVFYSDTRTSLQLGKMLELQNVQCQDNLHGSLESPKATPTQAQPVQSCTQPVLSTAVTKHRLDEAIAAAALTSLSSGPMVLAAATGVCYLHWWYSTQTSEVGRMLQRAPNSGRAPDVGSNSEACPESVVISSKASSCNSCDLYNYIPSTPSPPLQAATLSAHSDAGLEDSDTTHFLFGEPVPRKRKNSGRLMFRCLWKNCAKVLSTSAAIQKHIRTSHLGPSTEQEHNDGEEDFYYTEMDANVDTLTDGLSSLTPTSPTTTVPPSFICAGSLGAANNTELPLVSPLSLSAPSTLCHVHTDHAYQAPSPISVSVTSKVSFSWQCPPLLIKAPPVRPTFDINEKRPQILTAASNPKQVPGTRKPRGEAKKCRKVYGMERKDLWCTACRWKKACQRFID